MTPDPREHEVRWLLSRLERIRDGALVHRVANVRHCLLDALRFLADPELRASDPDFDDWLARVIAAARELYARSVFRSPKL